MGRISIEKRCQRYQYDPPSYNLIFWTVVLLVKLQSILPYFQRRAASAGHTIPFFFPPPRASIHRQTMEEPPPKRSKTSSAVVTRSNNRVVSKKLMQSLWDKQIEQVIFIFIFSMLVRPCVKCLLFDVTRILKSVGRRMLKVRLQTHLVRKRKNQSRRLRKTGVQKRLLVSPVGHI